MKYKTTRKAVLEGYVKVVSVGYCELTDVLKYLSPIAYTSGIYGWNCDVYEFGAYAIATGYRTTGKKVPYDTVKAWCESWEAIEASTTDYSERKTLAKAFIYDKVRCV